MLQHVQVCWGCRCTQVYIFILLQSPFSWRWHTSDDTKLTAAHILISAWLTTESVLSGFLFSNFRLFEVVWCQGPESRQVIEEKTFFVPAIAHVALLNNNSTWKSKKLTLPDRISTDLKMLLSNSTLATVSHIFRLDFALFFYKVYGGRAIPSTWWLPVRVSELVNLSINSGHSTKGDGN